jgi:SAM-dependent methyltransferase
MDQQFEHAVLPRANADERGRENFIAAMRRYLINDVYPGSITAYERGQKTVFVREYGRPPTSYREVRDLMETDLYYQSFSLLMRATQELLWDTVGESVERQLKTLNAAAKNTPAAGGSLRLQPDFELPAYATAVDIHVNPGGFHFEFGPDDVYAGAVYDRGVYIYAYGELGPLNNVLGQGTVDFIRARFPGLMPRKILELGCGVGTATLPLAAAWPEAVVYGVDISAPMLRYGYARANSLGVPIHFSQQNAAQTDFADQSFDLVVSNLLLHEIPQKLTKAIIFECHRLLRTGGVMVHNDMVGWPTDPFQEFMAGWNGHHNNEPFERGSGTLAWREACVAAGFRAQDAFLQPMDAAYLSEQLAFVGYRGAVRQ